MCRNDILSLGIGHFFTFWKSEHNRFEAVNIFYESIKQQQVVIFQSSPMFLMHLLHIPHCSFFLFHMCQSLWTLQSCRCYISLPLHKVCVWKCFKCALERFQMSTGNVSNGHWKCIFNNSQHGNRGTLWDFPPLEGRSHIFAQKPSLGVLFCIYVNHLKGLRKSANLQRCLCPRHVILNAPLSLFLSSTQKPFFSALMETYFKPTILHQIGAQMVNKFMSKQFNSEIDIPAPTYKHIYTLGCTEISKTF